MHVAHSKQWLIVNKINGTLYMSHMYTAHSIVNNDIVMVQN